MPSVAKKLSHNGLGVCESVPEGVLASVPCRGPRDHGTTGPKDQRTKGPRGQRTKGPKDQRRSRKLLWPGGEYLKRAGVPSVPKKLSHNGLGVCESVPESVLASVPGSGPWGHGTTGAMRTTAISTYGLIPLSNYLAT